MNVKLYMDIKQYIMSNLGLSIRQYARILNCSKENVRTAIRLYEIEDICKEAREMKIKEEREKKDCEIFEVWIKYHEEMSAHEMCKRFSINYSRMRWILKDRCVSQRKGYIRTQIERLLQEGNLSGKEIAEKLGCTQNYVYMVKSKSNL